jgi:hypothetical protein
VTVGLNQNIFFPLVNVINNNVGVNPPLSTSELQSQIDGIIPTISNLSASVDGQSIGNLASHRETSGPFTVNLPDNNVLGAPAGLLVPNVSDGFWLMLAPLPPGNHVIKFGGDFGAFENTQAITYKVAVIPLPAGVWGGAACLAIMVIYSLRNRRVLRAA